MKNKTKLRHIIISVLVMILVIIAGTFAWLSFRSKDTAMVLTVGQIDNVRITLSPYQIKSNMGSVLDYTSGTVTNVEAINNSSSSKKFKLYYKINSIDSNLAISSFKYTITRSTTKNGTYTTYGTEGNFNGTTSNSEKIILEETLASNETYYYKVYIWLDGNGNVSSASGKVFNAELRADILGHTVTFDANGGTVDITSKEVTTGLQYGELPTPTRKGYKFLGWHGKNLFEESDLVNSTKWRGNQNVTVTKTNDYVQVIYNQNSSTPGYITYIPNAFLENGKIYTISIYAKGVENNAGYLYVAIYGNTALLYNLSSNTFKTLTKTFTFTEKTSNNSYVLIYNNPPSNGTGFQVKWLQIEEGSTATPYEPYYITSDTTVVQDQDHTLTAIWEEANPVVTLNADGGTIPATSGWTVNGSTATKQIGYNDVYGNLPMPTRSGYTFLGWHGKNLFDEEKIFSNVTNYTYNNGYYIIDPPNAYSIYKNGSSNVVLDSTKRYTLSYTAHIDGEQYGACPGILYSDNSSTYGCIGGNIDSNYKVISVLSKQPTSIMFTYHSNRKTYLKNVQLEEGSTATPYEPYYISSNTTVVQENNHTLTAMWKAN